MSERTVDDPASFDPSDILFNEKSSFSASEKPIDIRKLKCFSKVNVLMEESKSLLITYVFIYAFVYKGLLIVHV